VDEKQTARDETKCTAHAEANIAATFVYRKMKTSIPYNCTFVAESETM
jgi:hypothetical protein